MTTGIWIDEKGDKHRRWLCKCGNLRPSDMTECGSCDIQCPGGDEPDVWELLWALEGLQK